MGRNCSLGKYLGHSSNHNTMDKRHPSTRTYSEDNKSESRGNTAKVSVMKTLFFYNNTTDTWHAGYPSSNTSNWVPVLTPMVNSTMYNVWISPLPLRSDCVIFKWLKEFLCFQVRNEYWEVFWLTTVTNLTLRHDNLGWQFCWYLGIEDRGVRTQIQGRILTSSVMQFFYTIIDDEFWLIFRMWLSHSIRTLWIFKETRYYLR